MTDETNQLTKLQRWCAHLVGKDTEVLAQCPAGERQDVVPDTFALLLLALLELGLWTFAMISFGTPWPRALLVGTLVALIIATLDVRLTASDNELRGVLRRGRRGEGSLLLLATRFALCVQLALGPAIAIDLAVFRPEANERMREDRSKRNAPLIKEYEEKLRALEEAHVGPLTRQLEQLARQRDQTQAARARAEREIVAAQSANRAAELEMQRQESGLGDRDEGHGELADDAQHRAALAQEQVDAAQTTAAEQARETGGLDREITGLEARRTLLMESIEPERARLIAERDTRLAGSTDGVLTTFMGLIRLHEDPDRGTGMLVITLVLWSITMALELSFFLRTLFKAASVYDALLTIERQKRVALATRAFAAALNATRQRAPLRVVPAAVGNP